MALPTLVRTWQFNVSNLIAGNATFLTQCQNLMWALKEMFKGNNGGGTWTDATGVALGGAPSGAGTVKSSSDGVGGFGNGDDVDRWVTAANLIWAAGAVNHSWIVIQFAGISASCQVCIDLNVASGSAFNCTIVLFPTGYSVAGTATARPTAANEVVIVNAASWGAPGSNPQSTRLSVMISTDGKGIRALMHRANGDTLWGEIQQPANTVGGWASPVVGMWRATSNSAGAKNATIQVMLQNYNVYGRPAATSGGHYCTQEAIWGTSANNQCAALQNVANDADSAFPFFPVGFYSDVVGLRGRNGSLVDCWCGPDVNAVGTTFPAAGTLYQFVQAMGDFITPWNQTVPNFV